MASQEGAWMIIPAACESPLFRQFTRSVASDWLKLTCTWHRGRWLAENSFRKFLSLNLFKDAILVAQTHCGPCEAYWPLIGSKLCEEKFFGKNIFSYFTWILTWPSHVTRVWGRLRKISSKNLSGISRRLNFYWKFHLTGATLQYLKG